MATATNIHRSLWHSPLYRLCAIMILGICAYANSFTAALQFDDDLLVRAIPARNLWSYREIIGNTRWLTDVTFSINQALHQEQVVGYHLVNLLIHLAATALVFTLFHLLIEALLGSVSGDENSQNLLLHRFIPFAGAALFAVHPIQTQAVTYIIQRYTSLAALFYLGSLAAFVKARLAGSVRHLNRTAFFWYTTCFVLALLAMKSKESAFTLPIMITLIEYLLFKGALLRKPVFLGCGAILLSLIPLQVLLSGSPVDHGLAERLQAASSETGEISRSSYLLTQCAVVATYLRLLIAPVNQNVDYDYPLYHHLTDLPVAGGVLIHSSLLGSAYYLFRRSRSPGTSLPAAALMRLTTLGICWFYLALAVESSFIPIRDVIFEHRLYLPSAGFLLAALSGTAALIFRFRSKDEHRMADRHEEGFARRLELPAKDRFLLYGGALVMAGCLLLAGATWQRNQIWQTELSLWQDVVAKSPRKARGHHALGSIYFRKFQPEQALPHLVTALELDASSEKYWVTLNDTVCIMKRLTGRCNDGRKFYTEEHGVSSDSAAQWWGVSYNNLGLAYEQLHNQAKAGEYYRKAISAYPDMDLPWGNLALVSNQLHDSPTTARALSRLEVINPAMARAITGIIQKQ